MQTWLRAANAASRHFTAGCNPVVHIYGPSAQSNRPYTLSGQSEPQGHGLLFIAKICKDSLPNSFQPHLDIVHPGSSLEELTSTLSTSSAKGAPVQQSAHRKWMQSQYAADRSFRKLHAGSLHHHIAHMWSFVACCYLPSCFCSSSCSMLLPPIHDSLRCPTTTFTGASESTDAAQATYACLSAAVSWKSWQAMLRTTM